MAAAKQCDLCKTFFLESEEIGDLSLREFDKDVEKFEAIDLCPECESSLSAWALSRKLKGTVTDGH